MQFKKNKTLEVQVSNTSSESYYQPSKRVTVFFCFWGWLLKCHCKADTWSCHGLNVAVLWWFLVWWITNYKLHGHRQIYGMLSGVSAGYWQVKTASVTVQSKLCPLSLPVAHMTTHTHRQRQCFNYTIAEQKPSWLLWSYFISIITW